VSDVDGPGQPPVIPLFPLPNVVLFPHLRLLDVLEFAVREGLTGASSAGKDRWLN
jgi:hypothetical protein